MLKEKETGVRGSSNLHSPRALRGRTEIGTRVCRMSKPEPFTVQRLRFLRASHQPHESQPGTPQVPGPLHPASAPRGPIWLSPGHSGPELRRIAKGQPRTLSPEPPATLPSCQKQRPGPWLPGDAAWVGQGFFYVCFGEAAEGFGFLSLLASEHKDH